MRRADRLFTIVQMLRGGRRVTALHMAQRLEVSERTIYRDVDELTLCGVPIEGKPGEGFRLPKSFEIPPLMFDRKEIEALVVGARLVESWCGPELAAAARSALTRIRGVIPAQLIDSIDEARIFAPQFSREARPAHFDDVHRALNEHRRLHVTYSNDGGEQSTRSIRPLGLYFWGKVWTLAAWCELRNDFRSFRLDRMQQLTLTDLFTDEPAQSLEAFLAKMRSERKSS